MSLRMGRCKLLEKLEGRTLVEHSVGTFARSDVDEVIVVLGDRAEAVSRAVSRVGSPKVKTVMNELFQQGLSSSIRMGISCVDPRSEAAFISLADMPLVPVDVVNRLILEYRETHACVVLPSYRGVDGHPVLFDRSVFQRLMSLQGDEGAKPIVRSRNISARRVEVDTPAVHIDIDTLRDLREAEELVRKIEGSRRAASERR